MFEFREKHIEVSLGFPILLKNVEIIESRSVLTPNINYASFDSGIAKELPFKRTRLTGRQISFLRLKNGISLENFSKLLDDRISDTMKWIYNTGVPDISWSKERDIRLLFLSQYEDAEKIGEAFLMLIEKLPEPDAGEMIEAVEFSPSVWGISRHQLLDEYTNGLF